MKKTVALACAGLMALSVVTGCSSGKKAPASDEKKVVKFDAFSGGNGDKVWKDLKAAFEKKNKNIEIQLRFEKDLPAVLNKENSKGEYSDIVYYNLGQQSQFTETQLNNKKVADISAVFADENVKKNINMDFANNNISQYYGDGKNYLAPFIYTPGGFYYNKELVGEGKKYALPTTWDEFFAVGDKAKANGSSLFTYATAGYFDNTILSMLSQAGGTELLNKVLTYDKDVWGTPEGKKVTDLLGKLVSKNYMFANTVANANVKDGFTKNQQAVLDGKALFMPNGSWVVNEMSKTTPEKGFTWGVMPVPAMEKDGKKAITTFTEQLWVPADAKNKDAAIEFLKFVYSPEAADIMLKNNMVAPVNGVTEKLTGLNKDLYAVYGEENVTAVIGTFAPFDSASIPDVDMKKVLCFTADDVNTGKKTAADWNADLVKTWKTISEHPVK